MAPQILIIDDSGDDCELMKRALEKTEPAIEVAVCEEPEDALDMLFDAERPLPRVVLLDLRLRHPLDGHDVLRKIRGHERTSHLPVVVLTGHADARKTEQSLLLGANSHVHKPLEAEKLAELMVRLGNYWTRLNVVPALYRQGTSGT